MAFRKSSDTRPQILDVSPVAAIPGGEFQIRGKGLAASARPQVRFGEVTAPVVIGSDSFVIVRVPDGTSANEMIIGGDHHASVPWTCGIGILVADSMHPVSNPVVDRYGNIYTTFSGSAGQKTAVSVYKIDTNHKPKPLVSDLMNATGLVFDAEGVLYVSSRHDGVIYQVSPAGNLAVYVEGMGVATGIVFDEDENMYVGDRSGTIFKISRQRQIYVFATLEPSIAAYHLAFGPEGYLYVTGPTTSSFDAVHRVSKDGKWKRFIAGWGVRREWRSTRTGTCTWRHPSAGGAAWCESRPRGRRNCSCRVRRLLGWRSRRRNPWCWRRIIPFTGWTWGSKGVRCRRGRSATNAAGARFGAHSTCVVRDLKKCVTRRLSPSGPNC